MISRMLSRRAWHVLIGMAMTGVVWAVGLLIASFAGVLPVPMPLGPVVAFALVLPGFVALVCSGAVQGRKEQQASLWPLFRRLPVGVLIVAAGLSLAFWLVGWTSMPRSGVSAVREDGQYTIQNQNQGTVTVVDKATYDRAVQGPGRLAVSSGGFFGVFAVIGAASMLRARVEA
jgi:hypothetical protein